MDNPALREKKIHLAINDFIKSNPNGVMMSSLVKGTRFSRKAIEKHLQVLILENEIYMKQFGITKVYYPNQKVKHLDFEKLSYGNKIIWFDILENEYGKYLLIQKKKKVDDVWVHEHSITLPLDKSRDFLKVLEKILNSSKIKGLLK
ncbi:MAG: hypothetical protein ABIH82_01805 [Candidatus Woesearchaeota archaeon]